MVRRLSVLRVSVSGSLLWDDHTYPHSLQSFLTSNESCKLLVRLSGVRGLLLLLLLCYWASYLLPRFTEAMKLSTLLYPVTEYAHYRFLQKGNG